MTISKLRCMAFVAGAALLVPQLAVAHPDHVTEPPERRQSGSTASGSSGDPSSTAYLSIESGAGDHYQYVYEFEPLNDAEVVTNTVNTQRRGLAGFLFKTFSGSVN